MPTLLTLPADGPTNRHLIERAYGECGVSDPDSDDIARGLRKLEAMGRTFPFNASGYIEGGLPEDASGIDPMHEDAVVGQLAKRLAPDMGKTLSAEQKSEARQALASLKAAVVTLPRRYLGASTVAGAGNRWRRYSPFINEVPEVIP